MTYLVPHIAVINQSKSVNDADLDNWVAAVQHQVQQHFHPKWDRNCTMAVATSVPSGVNVWPCFILDHSDVSGALGYHDDQNGVPILKVAAADTIADGASVSVCLSHEVLEALGDPLCNQAAQVGNSTFYAQEVCDACEGDQFGYNILLTGRPPVLVSDFVLPAWFTGDPGPYSYRGNVKQAGQLLSGGYIGVWTPQKGWQQKIADDKAPTSHRIAARAAKWGQTGEVERVKA